MLLSLLRDLHAFSDTSLCDPPGPQHDDVGAWYYRFSISALVLLNLSFILSRSLGDVFVHLAMYHQLAELTDLSIQVWGPPEQVH